MIQVITEVLSFCLQPPPNVNLDGVNQFVARRPLLTKYFIICSFHMNQAVANQIARKLVRISLRKVWAPNN
jgi:hypothetical protein